MNGGGAPRDGAAIIVFALGNPLRGDDGVGVEIGRKLTRRLPSGVLVHEGADDALALVTAWQDAAAAFIIDAAVSGARPGTVHRFEADGRPLPRDIARCSSHGLGLAEAMRLGQVLDRLPPRLICYAVEGLCFDHGAGLSREVQAAIDDLVDRLAAEIACCQSGAPETAHA